MVKGKEEEDSETVIFVGHSWNWVHKMGLKKLFLKNQTKIVGQKNLLKPKIPSLLHEEQG